MFLPSIQSLIMKKTPVQIKEVVAFADKLDFDNLGAGLVPCRGIDDRKVPLCKAWQKAGLSLEDIEEFKKLEMLGVVLGDELLVIDCDGISAVKAFDSLVNQGVISPSDLDTFTVSSREGRKGFFFIIPEEFQGKLKFFKVSTAEKEQIEFRTGRQYQIFAGKHPETGKPYLSNEKSVKIASDKLLKWLLENQSKDTSMVLEVLEVLETRSKKEQYVEVELVPLWRFLSRENRKFFKNPTEGNRNLGCFALACELLGLEQKLFELGIDYEGTAEDTYKNFYKKIPGKETFKKSEFEKCWEQATSQERDTVIDDEYLERIAGVFEDEGIEALDALDTEDDNLEDAENTSGTDFDKETETKKKKVNSSKALEKKLSQSAIEEFQDIRNVKLHDIKLEKYLSPELAEAFRQHAKAYDIPLEFLLICFYTSVSGVLPKGLEFNWNGGDKSGNAIPNIFTLLVADPAYGKNRIVDPFTKPLLTEASRINNLYADYQEAINELEKSWKDHKNKEREEIIVQYCDTAGKFYDPTIPLLAKKALFAEAMGIEIEEDIPPVPAQNDATFPSINELAGSQTEQGFLICPSELVEFIRKNDTVSNTKDSTSKLIQIWDGATTLQNYKTKELRQKADTYQVSLLSTIQTARMETIFKKSDPSGVCSRFLYLNLDKPIFSPIGDRGEYRQNGLEIELADELAAFYPIATRELTRMVPLVEDKKGNISRQKVLIHLRTESDIAKKIKSKAMEAFQAFIQECRDLGKLNTAKNKAAEQWLFRLAENTARIILSIHCTMFASGLIAEKDFEIVSPKALVLGLLLARVLMAQYQMTHKCIFEDTETFDEDLHLLMEFNSVCKDVCTKKGLKSIKTSNLNGRYILEKASILDAFQTVRSKKDKLKRLTSEEIKAVFQMLAESKLGTYSESNGYSPL